MLNCCGWQAIRQHLENTIDTRSLAETAAAAEGEDTSGPITSRASKAKKAQKLAKKGKGGGLRRGLKATSVKGAIRKKPSVRAKQRMGQVGRQTAATKTMAAAAATKGKRLKSGVAKGGKTIGLLKGRNGTASRKKLASANLDKLMGKS